MIAEGGIRDARVSGGHDRGGDAGLVLVAQKLGDRDAGKDGRGRGAGGPTRRKPAAAKIVATASPPGIHPSQGACATIGALHDPGVVGEVTDQDEQRTDSA